MNGRQSAVPLVEITDLGSKEEIVFLISLCFSFPAGLVHSSQHEAHMLSNETCRLAGLLDYI